MVFGERRHAPNTSEGRRLIAHELTHVVQQRRGGTGPAVLASHGALEQEATKAAELAVKSRAPIAVSGRSGLALARQHETEEDRRLRQRRERAWRSSGIVIPGLTVPSGPPEPIRVVPRPGPPRITTIDGPNNTREVFVDGLHLATLRFPSGGSADSEIASTRDEDGRPVVRIRVPSGTTVEDHNPRGDGPNRYIQLSVATLTRPAATRGAVKGPPAKPPVVTTTPAPPAAEQDVLPPNPYADILAEDRAESVRGFLPWYTVNANEKILGVFRSCTPMQFQELQEKLGSDMGTVIDKLDPFSAVQLGAIGPVKEGIEALNRKRAEYIVESSLDFGIPVAQIFVFHMFSQMYTNDIKSVLQILAGDRDLNRTVLDPSMKDVQKYLSDRGIDLSKFKERSFEIGDVGRPVGEFLSRDIWDKTIFADARYGRMVFQSEKLPKELGDLVMPAYYGQYYGNLTTGDLAYGVVDHITLGIPLGFYGAVKGAGQGVSDIARGEPEKGIKELIPALIIVLTSLGAKGVRAKTAQEGKATPKGELRGPAGKGQFTLPGYEGPVSPEAARVGALLTLSPEAQGAGGVLLDRLGPDGLQKAAGYIQNDSAAARFVAKGGLPALEALVEAEGNVTGAEMTLAERKSAPQLPPGPATKMPGSGFATGVGELREPKVQGAHYPESLQLPEKAPGADLVDLSGGGTRADEIAYERVPARKTKSGQTIPAKNIVVVNSKIKGGHWISLKTVFVATARNMRENVNAALERFANAWKSTTPRPRFEQQPMVSPNIHWRVLMDGKPDKITIHLDLESGTIGDELTSAAEDAVRGSPYMDEMPPGDLVITDAKGGLYRRSLAEITKGKK